MKNRFNELFKVRMLRRCDIKGCWKRHFFNRYLRHCEKKCSRCKTPESYLVCLDHLFDPPE